MTQKTEIEVIFFKYCLKSVKLLHYCEVLINRGGAGQKYQNVCDAMLKPFHQLIFGWNSYYFSM